MSHTESGTMTAHQFSAINIAGHARVIVGSTHGPDETSQSEQALSPRWPTRFNARLTDLCQTTSHSVDVDYILQLAVLIVRDLDALELLVHTSALSSRADWWLKDLAVRQAIFRSCLQNVLSTCSDMDSVREMLQDEYHAMWADEDFVARTQETYGQHIMPIRHALELIDRDIAALGGRIQSLTSLSESPQLARNNSYGQVDHQLASLKNHIHDFRDLVQQHFSFKRHVSSTGAPSRVKKKVDEFRTVQRAAGDLYQSFLLACEQHQQHRVWLRIERNQCQEQNIEFNLVLDRTPMADEELAAPSRAKLSLVVRSALSTSLCAPSPFSVVPEYVYAIDSQTQSLKRGHDCIDSNTKHKRRKPGTSQSDGERQTAPSSVIPNFCEKGDMCTHISRSHSSLRQEEQLLGILSPVNSSHHAMYTLKGEGTERISKLEDRLQYITQVLSSSDEEDTLMRHVKIRLAKQLSIAVLQYNATPWLQQSWDSNHVLVEKEDSQQSIERNIGDIADLSDPRNMSYLDVTIQKPSSLESGIPQETPRTMIRNATLFHLGVMLIELAYDRSFPSMHRPGDVFVHNDARVSEENTNYCAADRLQKGVARKLGPVYARLVRQCIDCDFGHGQDLAKTELQEGFYEHVVDKLEDLEAKFKELAF